MLVTNEKLRIKTGNFYKRGLHVDRNCKTKFVNLCQSIFFILSLHYQTQVEYKALLYAELVKLFNVLAVKTTFAVIQNCTRDVSAVPRLGILPTWLLVSSEVFETQIRRVCLISSQQSNLRMQVHSSGILPRQLVRYNCSKLHSALCMCCRMRYTSGSDNIPPILIRVRSFSIPACIRQNLKPVSDSLHPVPPNRNTNVLNFLICKKLYVHTYMNFC